ncbi:MAG: hypothetical protein AAGD43_23995 [Pseudomonadota bacterium]
MTQHTKRIAQTPREIAHCVSAFLKEGDMDGIVSMFHPDCHIFFPPDQPASVGLDGAREAFLKGASGQVKFFKKDDKRAAAFEVKCTG